MAIVRLNGLLPIGSPVPSVGTIPLVDVPNFTDAGRLRRGIHQQLEN